MKFPTCNRRAPAAPYYAALHSMNGGPEGRLSYVVTVLFRRVSQIRIRWLLHFSFESAALIHHIMMLAHSSAAHRMRSQDYLLWVGCCMSLVQLS